MRKATTKGIYASPNRRGFVARISKQEVWRKRVGLLWKIKGIVIPMDAPMTYEENKKLAEAQKLIADVVSNFTKNSVTLGFNAVERCHYCGKPASSIDTAGFHICDNCMRLRNKELN